MKKALVILLALTMVMSMFAMVPASAADEELAVGQVAADYKPEGTAINNAAEFAAMDPAGTYYLAADITLDETYAAIFTGTFDGNGKTVTTTVPLFEQVDGTAKNITIKGAINLDTPSSGAGEDRIGALAKCVGNTAPAVIDNVCNMAPITSAELGIGGLIGLVSNDADHEVVISNCVNYGNITASNSSTSLDCGGIASGFDGNNGHAEYYCQFINCANYGIVNACGRPGGIVGYANASASFVNCVNEGEIQSTANYCGGIAGRLDGDSGKNYFLLENCVNRGKVIVWQSQGAGMVGYCGGYSELIYKNCTNYGDIIGHPDNPKGVVLAGIHGNNNKAAIDTYFINCVNYGNIGLDKQADGITAAGIAGGVRGKTSGTISFQNCYNYGEMKATNRGAGIAGGAPWADNVVKTLEFISCGNYADITSTKQAAGICSYSYASWTSGPVMKYCVTTGDITGGTFTAGLIGYMNCGYTGVNNKIEYNVVAGKLTGPEATPVTDGAAVTLQIPYSFTDSNGNTKYFYAPAVGTVSIVGDKVTFIADLTHKDAVKPVAGVVGFKPSAATYVTYEIDGVKYLGQVAKNATLNAIDAENKGIVVNDYFVPGQVVPADFDATTWEVTTYDHPISTYAYFWNNKSAIEVDQSENFVAEGTADMAYFCGGANAWSALSAAEIVETPIADFANGTVAYELNEMIGETVFYQNIDSNLFVVDAFPTTDATHAKVVKVAGVIGNQLFDINNDSGSPATGDAIVYVVVALAVSTISLAAVAVCKKIKEN